MLQWHGANLQARKAVTVCEAEGKDSIELHTAPSDIQRTQWMERFAGLGYMPQLWCCVRLKI